MLSDINRAASAELTDPVDNMFSEDITERLPSQYTQLFQQALAQPERPSIPSAGRPYYSIVFRDDNGKELTKLTVCDLDTVTTDTGAVGKKGSLKRVLESLEKNMCITSDIQKRVPGENYLFFLKDVSYIKVNEVMPNQFCKRLNMKLDASVLDDLRNSLDGIRISEKPEVFKARYIFDLYSEDGSSLYTFRADKDGTVVTDYGYEIIGTPFTRLVSEYEKTREERENPLGKTEQ